MKIPAEVVPTKNDGVVVAKTQVCIDRSGGNFIVVFDQDHLTRFVVIRHGIMIPSAITGNLARYFFATNAEGHAVSAQRYA